MYAGVRSTPPIVSPYDSNMFEARFGCGFSLEFWPFLFQQAGALVVQNEVQDSHLERHGSLTTGKKQSSTSSFWYTLYTYIYIYIYIYIYVFFSDEASLLGPYFQLAQALAESVSFFFCRGVVDTSRLFAAVRGLL